MYTRKSFLQNQPLSALHSPTRFDISPHPPPSPKKGFFDPLVEGMPDQHVLRALTALATSLLRVGVSLLNCQSSRGGDAFRIFANFCFIIFQIFQHCTFLRIFYSIILRIFFPRFARFLAFLTILHFFCAFFQKYASFCKIFAHFFEPEPLHAFFSSTGSLVHSPPPGVVHTS